MRKEMEKTYENADMMNKLVEQARVRKSYFLVISKRWIKRSSNKRDKKIKFFEPSMFHGSFVFQAFRKI